MSEFLENWEKQVQKSTMIGTVEEREVVVPYSVEDTFSAALDSIFVADPNGLEDEIKIFERKDNAVLFGMKKAVVARALNFKGFVIVKPDSDGSYLHIKVKKPNAGLYVGNFFNFLEESLENFEKKTSANLSNQKENKDDSTPAENTPAKDDSSVKKIHMDSKEYESMKKKDEQKFSNAKIITYILIGILIFFIITRVVLRAFI